MKTHFFFRFVLGIGAATALLLTPLQVTHASESITRSEIITRAQVWVNATPPIPYNQGAYYMGYRTDCSGFVSYALGLTTGSGTPESRTTVTLDYVSYQISKDELKAGDILNDNDPGNSGHVVIFHEWTNSERTQYWGYDLSLSGVQHRIINYPFNSNPQDWIPRRYNKVIEDPPILANQFVDSGIWNSAYGTAGDLFFTGDFDGNGYGDLISATPRLNLDNNAATNDLAWFVLKSNGTTFFEGSRVADSWGISGDKFFIGDFDGDGNDDLINATTRLNLDKNPASNDLAWSVLKSNGTTFYQGSRIADSWGLGTDQFFIGDFDGDGKDDVISAISRFNLDNNPATDDLAWYVLKSDGTKFVSDSRVADSWGISGEKFFIGDFDGDGKDDVISAISRLNLDNDSTTNDLAWYVMKSNGTIFVDVGRVLDSWAWTSDKHFIADFDGDGKDDILVATSRLYADGALRWYVATSNGDRSFIDKGMWAHRWGLIGDDILIHNYRKSDNTNTKNFDVLTGRVVSNAYTWWAMYADKSDAPFPAFITSITRDNPNPTNLSSVSFTVTFSQPVTGVDTATPFDDFVLTKTGGVFGAAVVGVSGSGVVYKVTVNTGSGNGTLRLDVTDNDTIVDLTGSPMADLPFTSGESYTVVKNDTGASGIVQRQGMPATPDLSPNSMICSSVTAIGAETYGSLNTDGNGAFQFSDQPGGTYTFRAAYPGYLASEKTGVSVSTTIIDLGTTILRGGDVNGDNAINIYDVVKIVNKFGQSGVAIRGATCSDPDEAADINNDGLVNIRDLTITTGNWGKVSPQPWQP